MRRTDRLFELIQILRDGQLHRARDMAQRLEVSDRTIYRDMETLMASGIPVEGERGVGYMMTAPITLPPLNLTMAELEALHIGMAILGEAVDAELQEAARSLSAKIDAVLPEDSVAPPTGAKCGMTSVSSAWTAFWTCRFCQSFSWMSPAKPWPTTLREKPEILRNRPRGQSSTNPFAEKQSSGRAEWSATGVAQASAGKLEGPSRARSTRHSQSETPQGSLAP